MQRTEAIFTVFKLPGILKTKDTVAQLVEAQRYKMEGRRFDSRWGHCDFSLILPAAMALGSTQSLTELSNRDRHWG
jgi:hypothetical protein